MQTRIERMVEQGRAATFAELFAAETQIEGETHQGKHWQPYSHAAWEAALASGSRVIVDFTADWCVNCKVLEATVLRSEAILALLDELDIVSFQADCTREGEGQELLLMLGPFTVPTWAIFDPANPTRPRVERGWTTQRSLAEMLRTASP